MPHHIASLFGAAASILKLALVAPALTATQGFPLRSRVSEEYQVVLIHDRLTDSSRVTASFTGSSRPFGLDSRAWLGISFSFPGYRLTSVPATVTLTVEAWTPARGGWAFAHPQPLRVRSGDSLRLEVAPSGYAKRRVHLFDRGRREELSFEIPPADFARLARAPDLVFTAGRARFKVHDRMAMLREVARRLSPPDRGRP